MMGQTCHRQYGRSGVPSLCVFGKPYILDLCDPVGSIASYVHFGIRLALAKQPLLKAQFNAGCVVIAGVAFIT